MKGTIHIQLTKKQKSIIENIQVYLFTIAKRQRLRLKTKEKEILLVQYFEPIFSPVFDF